MRLLTALLLSAVLLSTARAQTPCERPRLHLQAGPARAGYVLITWADCREWFQEYSTDLVRWTPYAGPRFRVCPGGATNACYFLIIDPTTHGGARFWRLRRASAAPALRP